MKDKVIVADSELHTSFAVIRSVRRYGLNVISIGRSRFGDYLSNCVFKKFCLSNITDEEYCDFIVSVAKIENVKAIFAHYEKTLIQLGEKIREQRLDFKIISPPLELLKLATKKENILSVVKELNVPLPRTIYYDNERDSNFNELIQDFFKEKNGSYY